VFSVILARTNVIQYFDVEKIFMIAERKNCFGVKYEA